MAKNHAMVESARRMIGCIRRRLMQEEERLVPLTGEERRAKTPREDSARKVARDQQITKNPLKAGFSFGPTTRRICTLCPVLAPTIKPGQSNRIHKPAKSLAVLVAGVGFEPTTCSTPRPSEKRIIGPCIHYVNYFLNAQPNPGANANEARQHGCAPKPIHLDSRSNCPPYTPNSGRTSPAHSSQVSCDCMPALRIAYCTCWARVSDGAPKSRSSICR